MDARKAAVLADINQPLKNELMMGEIIAIDSGESRSGRPQCPVKIAPVVNDYAEFGLALTLYVQRQMDGDETNTKKLGELRAKGRQFLVAVDPDFPKPPRKVSQGIYETQDGLTLQGNDITAAFQAHGVVTFQALERLANDEAYRDSLVGKRVFFKPQKLKKDKETGLYPDRQFISFVTHELRDGDTLCTDDVVDQVVLAEMVDAALAGLDTEE